MEGINDWLSTAQPKDLRTFHERIRAAHRGEDRVPVDNIATHQWHYLPTAELLQCMQHWHEAGVLVHQQCFEMGHDTEDRVLATKHHARLWSRQVSWNMQESRKHDYNWFLTWQRGSSVKQLKGTTAIYYKLTDQDGMGGFGLSMQTFPNKRLFPLPCYYATKHVGVHIFDRYLPQLDFHLCNPRWWLDVEVRFVEEELTLPLSTTPYEAHREYRARLTVECDPVTQKWDSDDEEVEEHCFFSASGWTEWSYANPIPDLCEPPSPACETCSPKPRRRKKGLVGPSTSDAWDAAHPRQWRITTRGDDNSSDSDSE
jgi:hypothetical protein